MQEDLARLSKQQNSRRNSIEMHVKQYGENKLDFTYKICELTVSTQEKDSGIMFYENKSVLEIRKAN